MCVARAIKLAAHDSNFCSLFIVIPQAIVSLEELEKQFDMFVEEAHRLKAFYASEITLLVGAETELITDADCVGLEALLNRHGDRIEYLVGSIHHVNEIPIDYDQTTFQSALDSLSPEAELETESRTLAMGALLDRYLDAQYELMARFRPEVIGHMDLCRLYNPHLAFSRFPSAMEKLERNIKYACEYAALIEFNAAAFRKGWDTAYPGRDVLEVCRFSLTFTTCAGSMSDSPLCQVAAKYGGRYTISDDSHGPQAVGLNYGRLYNYLRDAGIEELWYLTSIAPSERAESAGFRRNVVPAKLHGDWWSHEFWKDKV